MISVVLWSLLLSGGVVIWNYLFFKILFPYNKLITLRVPVRVVLAGGIFLLQAYLVGIARQYLISRFDIKVGSVNDEITFCVPTIFILGSLFWVIILPGIKAGRFSNNPKVIKNNREPESEGNESYSELKARLEKQSKDRPGG